GRCPGAGRHGARPRRRHRQRHLPPGPRREPGRAGDLLREEPVAVADPGAQGTAGRPADGRPLLQERFLGRTVKPKILVLERSADLAEEIREAAAGIDPGVEVVACSRVGAVSDVIAQQGPFAVLFAGPSLASRSGLRRLAALHEDCPATSILLAFSDRPDATLREIVQAGGDDILRLPFDPDDLVMALERALDIGGRRLAGVAPKREPGVIPLPVAPAVPTQARVFTVSSATGGCGKTFMATNMALFLARHTGKRVVLVDLDLQFGEVSTALRLRPNYTI